MSINRNMSILAAGASSTGGLSNVASIGIGMTPSNVLDITQTQNSASIISLLNASSGVAANSRLYLGNATSATRGRLIQWGSSFTATGVYRQDGLLLECTGAGGVTIAANAVQPIYFAINDVEKVRIDTSGNLLVGATSVPPGGCSSAVAAVQFASGGNTKAIGIGGTWTIIYFSDGSYGGEIAGLLRVYTTYSGQQTTTMFSISGQGGSAAQISSLSSANYASGAAFTITVGSTASGSLTIVYTNTSGAAVNVSYTYLNIGGGTPSYGT